MIVFNGQGREFFVRVVFRGDPYGLDDKLVHDHAEPMVEFYDRSYASMDASVREFEREKFGPRGQFVSRYNASTLSKHEGGLNLCGHVPEWQIDDFALRPVVQLARLLLKGLEPEDPSSPWTRWIPKKRSA